MTTNVETLSRTELENIVMIQSGQLKTLKAQADSLKKDKEKLEAEYDAVSNVLLHLRIVLNSGLTPE